MKRNICPQAPVIDTVKMEVFASPLKPARMEMTICDKNSEAGPQHLTPPQVALRQNCCLETVRRKLRNGEIRALKIGRLWRVPVAFVEEYERTVATLEHTESNNAGSQTLSPT